MFLSLDDNLKGEGASVLLPSSHLIKMTMKKLKVELPPPLVNLFSFMFSSLSGLKGTIGIFSNRIWHGRLRNSSSSHHDILSVGFFPAGYSYGAGLPAELVSTYSGTELGRLIAVPSDLQGTITSNCECRESDAVEYFDGKAFSLNIEDHEFSSKFNKPPKLIFSVMVMRFSMLFVSLIRLLRKITGK